MLLDEMPLSRIWVTDYIDFSVGCITVSYYADDNGIRKRINKGLFSLV